MVSELVEAVLAARREGLPARQDGRVKEGGALGLLGPLAVPALSVRVDRGDDLYGRGVVWYGGVSRGGSSRWAHTKIEPIHRVWCGVVWYGGVSRGGSWEGSPEKSTYLLLVVVDLLALAARGALVVGRVAHANADGVDDEAALGLWLHSCWD